jgi:hypothetical protein
MKEWKEAPHKVWYYWKSDTGQIIGQVTNISHTDIYNSKVYCNNTEERYLGQYINSDFARKAIEHFWNIEERTLSYDSTP